MSFLISLINYDYSNNCSWLHLPHVCCL